MRSPDHRHWHLLGFDRYELRRPGGGRAWCATARAGSASATATPCDARAAAPSRPSRSTRAAAGSTGPGLLGIREGISVGYGDDYTANLEGQYLPLDGLRPGRYVLVHRVNADRRLRRVLATTTTPSSLLLRPAPARGGAPRSARSSAVCPDTEPLRRRRRPRQPRGDAAVETVATGLEIPWEIAFLPAGGRW